MKQRVAVVAISVAVIIASVAVARRGEAGRQSITQQTAASSRLSLTRKSVPVVVELFTSEGCSSCPPADALLAKLAKTSAVDGAVVIPLEEHVDYWNHLGWADPFSAARYTQRQQSYARLMRLNQVYTPQMVVDGRRELLGSDGDAARQAISESASAAKTEASISADVDNKSNVKLAVKIDPITLLHNNEAADVIVAITEDNLSSTVIRGENGGRKLQHTGVVRLWKALGVASSTAPFNAVTTVALQSIWKISDLHAIVFVQGHDSGTIYSVASAIIVPNSKDSPILQAAFPALPVTTLP